MEEVLDETPAGIATVAALAIPAPRDPARKPPPGMPPARLGQLIAVNRRRIVLARRVTGSARSRADRGAFMETHVLRQRAAVGREESPLQTETGRAGTVSFCSPPSTTPQGPRTELRAHLLQIPPASLDRGVRAALTTRSAAIAVRPS